jgi:hypothetical protein
MDKFELHVAGDKGDSEEHYAQDRLKLDNEIPSMTHEASGYGSRPVSERADDFAAIHRGAADLAGGW